MIRAYGEVLKSPVPLQTHLQKYHSHTHAHTHTPAVSMMNQTLVWGVVSALVTGRALHLRVDEHF